MYVVCVVADKQHEVLMTSKAIVAQSHEVARLAKKLAHECSDHRIKTVRAVCPASQPPTIILTCRWPAYIIHNINCLVGLRSRGRGFDSLGLTKKFY